MASCWCVRDCFQRHQSTFSHQSVSSFAQFLKPDSGGLCAACAFDIQFNFDHLMRALDSETRSKLLAF